MEGNEISIHVGEERAFSSSAYMDEGDEVEGSEEFAMISLELNMRPRSAISEEMALTLLDRTYIEVRQRVVESGKCERGD